MGMRIGSTSTNSSLQSVSTNQWQQRQQSFQNLMSALQSGNLSAAQSAYATLTGGSASSSTATAATSTATSATGTASASSNTSPLAQIGQALANGDLAGAQAAAQQLQASRAAGHHHHHHGGSSGSGSGSGGNGSQSTNLPITTTAVSATTPGSIINLQA